MPKAVWKGETVMVGVTRKIDISVSCAPRIAFFAKFCKAFSFVFINSESDGICRRFSFQSR